jgi:hypothetical protein
VLALANIVTMIHNIPQGQPVNRIVVVNGIMLQYTVYKLTDGTLNIGRIHDIR